MAGTGAGGSRWSETVASAVVVDGGGCRGG